MRKMILVCLVLFISSTSLYAQENNFSLGYWKIDVDTYMIEYDKKRAISGKNKKNLKLFRAITILSLENTVIEIKKDRLITYHVNTDKIVIGKQTKLDKDQIEFNADKDIKKREKTILKKINDNSMEYKKINRTFTLIKMKTKDAKLKIIEIKAKKKGTKKEKKKAK
ncbi:MAG: hypothetical protein COA79_17345 [Planctomycetota bacterium]|nr:MAG: hypothetical protein COA79_17345 [Planctomycetota bacterium]